MKNIIRAMVCATLALTFMLMQVTFGQQTIREDELNTIAREAISTVQINAREQIEDNVYGTSNARCRASKSCYTSNEDYIGDLKYVLGELIATNSDYTIDVYGVDYQKGLLDVGINCTYKTIAGNKTISVRKTSIVEIIGSESSKEEDTTEYTVTLDINSGEGTEVEPLTGKKNETIVLPENDWKKVNEATVETLIFKEYNTKADGSGFSYKIGDDYIINKDITLYAIYQNDETANPTKYIYYKFSCYYGIEGAPSNMKDVNVYDDLPTMEVAIKNIKNDYSYIGELQYYYVVTTEKLSDNDVDRQSYYSNGPWIACENNSCPTEAN